MTKNIHKHRILILDFGSQYTQLIARRVREIGVYCELWAWDVSEEQIREFNPSGIILSGSPESTTELNSPRAPEYVFTAGVPVLGVCYGMQTMAMQLGGHVQGSTEREFGYAQVEITQASALIRDIEDAISPAGKPVLDVWMSHGDKVTAIPSDFVTVASTDTCPFAIMANEENASTAYSFILKSPIPAKASVSWSVSYWISVVVKRCGRLPLSLKMPLRVFVSRSVKIT